MSDINRLDAAALAAIAVDDITRAARDSGFEPTAPTVQAMTLLSHVITSRLYAIDGTAPTVYAVIREVYDVEPDTVFGWLGGDTGG
ncbi:hypothetical protein GCM10010124_01990 [Pilimelia terevasa]|uniref:Uncharacterized protein n=1 Tax=Pilimelia terevasa TaxID=53372 RepID=A0A8J3FE80_9ACTN|nr:hypothetical protein [Pilimelia terevasa]GGK13051.1 hypothetical protein GCM10010124_01990 [Pilimelia terevasa]